MMCQMLDYTEEEIKNLRVGDIHPEAEVPHVLEQFEKQARREITVAPDIPMKRKDGSVFYADVSSFPITLAGAMYLAGIFRDVTERKRGEDELRRLSRHLLALSRCNQTIIRAEDEASLLEEICRNIVDIVGYVMAWVGFAEHDAARTVRPAASAGVEKGYLDSAKISWADVERGRGPTGAAIRSGKPMVVKDIRTDASFAPWRQDALQRGYLSSITLPLKAGSRVFGALNIYAAQTDAFDQAEVNLLTELADDLSYGIGALRTRARQARAEKALQRSSQRLRTTLQGTIEAIALIGEIRDPYTAGHERRVAQLASAIAQQMGFNEDQSEGVRVMAYLHDIGKIAVPAEILSYPGKLADTQFRMIKAHVVMGHKILQGIDFPWPVAAAVLQHHERLDGSGYAAGLSGEQIIAEARILGVADVVEAMSSHRPYRPALGIDKALEEITQNSGKLYDPAVADACVKLFREMAFQFDSGALP